MLPNPKSASAMPYAKRVLVNLKQKIVPKIPKELRFSQDLLIRELNATDFTGGICAALACLYIHLRRNAMTPAEAIDAMKYVRLGEIAVAAYSEYQREVKQNKEDKAKSGAKIGQQEVCRRITNLFNSCSERIATADVLRDFPAKAGAPSSWQASRLELHKDVDLLANGISLQANRFLEREGKDFKEGSFFSKKTVTFAEHGKRIEEMLPNDKGKGEAQFLYLRLESPLNKFAHAIAVENAGQNGFLIFDPNVGLIPMKQGMNIDSVGTSLSLLLAIYEITSMYVFSNASLPPALVKKPGLPDRKLSNSRY